MSDNRQIDELADLFEAAWNSGKRLGVDTFLAEHADGIDMDDLLDVQQELRLVEQELLRKYPQPKPCEQIGNYELLEWIGRGGMGELYRARHLLLNKIVAVKILPDTIAENPLAVKRFERELKLIGSLSHPNIVHAYDAERIGGKTLLIMEFVDGENLQQMVASGKKQTIDDALMIIRQAAVGLQYAYERKVIHRDIKPANIMLTKEGVVKILDFGLGKFYDEILLAEHEGGSGPLTKLGSPLGTLDFLAPEQWDSPGEVDIRADIYGLGCTFYTIVVGNVPYPSDQFRSIREKMVAHFQKPLQSFSSSGVKASPSAEAILRKMCEKDRNRRFATPQELLDAIDKYRLTTFPIKKGSQRKGWVVGGTVICLLGSAPFFLSHFGISHLNRPENNRDKVTTSNVSERVPISVAVKPIGPEVLAARYRGDLRTARRLCREWLDEMENIIPQPPEVAITEELLADCTLYGNAPNARGYEFYVEEADELYHHARTLSDSTDKRSILNSKRAILQMIAGRPLNGLKTLENGIEKISAEEVEKEGELAKKRLFFETARGIGGFYCGESHSERQASLRQVLDTFRLNSRSGANSLSDPWGQERFDLQLLCIRQLLKAELEAGELETARQDAATYLDPILLGAIADRRDLRPYLQKDYELAVRCYDNDPLKQAEYIYCQRMDDTYREGTSQLLFYFASQGGFAIFLPSNLSEVTKFGLNWTREDLRDNRVNSPQNRQKFLLDERLLALIQSEWDAGRQISLSWRDEMCFPHKNEGISFADWPFAPQLKLQSFIGIEK